MRTKVVKCRVFLEGLEVAFNSIQLSERKGQPPSAVISFPADSNVIKILPKTVCHIFWLDDNNVDRLLMQGELSGTGLNFDAQSRQIQLQFHGFTQNWRNNYILAMDLNLPSITNHAVMCVNYPETATEPGAQHYEYTSSKSELNLLADAVLELTKGKTLGTVLRELLKSFGTKGAYLDGITEAFNINNQVIAFDSRLIESILKIQSVAMYVNQQVRNLDAVATIHDALQYVLRAVGYEYIELAAPAMTGGGLKRIFIKPKTDAFPPILCNTVFDDEIHSLNFNRSIDDEPTRMINQTSPFEGTEDDQLMQFAISTVVPHEVVLAEEIAKLSATGGMNASNSILGLTEEEQCRGILLTRRDDTSGIENAYILAAINKVTGQDDVDMGKAWVNLAGTYRGPQGAKDEITSMFTKEGAATKYNEIHKYHIAMALIDFYDQRHAARICTVTAPFSPYRVIGIPGLVLATKYFPSLVGSLDSVDSYISADGNAVQTLTYTHTRVYTLRGVPNTSFVGPGDPDLVDFTPSEPFSFMDDNFASPPYWYNDFVFGDNDSGIPIYANKVGSFYASLTGRSDAALFIPRGQDLSGFGNAVKKLREEYIHAQNTGDTQTFILEKTTRPLPSKQDIKNSINPGLRDLQKTPIRQFTSKATFIRQRQKRVKDVFDITGVTLGVELLKEK